MVSYTYWLQVAWHFFSFGSFVRLIFLKIRICLFLQHFNSTYIARCPLSLIFSIRCGQRTTKWKWNRQRIMRWKCNNMCAYVIRTSSEIRKDFNEWKTRNFFVYPFRYSFQRWICWIICIYVECRVRFIACFFAWNLKLCKLCGMLPLTTHSRDKFN